MVVVRHFFLLPIVLSVFLLAGCETPELFSAGSPQIAATPDPVSARLAEAAERASKSLETLASVEYAKTPAQSVTPVNDAPPQLKRAITVNWVGPVEPITQTLANRSSYSFRTLGNTPSTPIVVSIDVENTPIVDVLRDIGLQLGQRADIKVDVAAQTVELHYAPTTVGSIDSQGF